MSEHKMCEKGSLFCGKTHKAENNLGQYAIFQEKRGDFVQIYSILPTQTYLGCQIWGKIPQNPYLRVVFASWLKYV